tara:strand:- start:6064 stop:7881 length:1818 start_codon:yes stop_codon:yes gene_type:complete
MVDARCRIALAIKRQRLEDCIDGASLKSLYGVSIVGWDSTSDLSSVDPTNFGVWRTGLILAGHGRPEGDARRIPIIHSDMTLAELENGCWRQLRILPEAPTSYADEDMVRTNPNDFYSTISGKVLADRDWLIFSLVGHTNRDAAEFLRSALLNDPKVGKLLLAKCFKEALALRPDLPAWEWPDETIARWKKTDGKDYLPPFYFLVILSEFQRLAQNATALMALSFRTDGTPLTIASIIEDIGEADSKKTGSAFDIFESSVANLTTLIPLQTYALLPKDSMISGKNSIDGIRYTANAFRAMKDFISRGSANMFAILSGYKKESQSALVALAMSAHPDHRKDRKVSGGNLAIRTEYVAKYWGLNWLEHPYFGLFQLAQAADRVNAKYRKIRRPLRVAHHQNRVINRGQAIARITRAWLETTHPAAYKKQWQERKAIRERNSSDRQYSTGFGYEKDEKNKEYSDHQYEYYDPLIDSLVDVEGKIDGRLLSKMKKQAAKKPEKGLPGYTAQYHYNLWFEKENDDIGFWIGRRNAAQECKIANLPLTSSMIVYEILSDIELLRKHPAAIEDIVSQNLAMTIGEFSLDPMHAFLRRRGLNLAKRYTNLRKT